MMPTPSAVGGREFTRRWLALRHWFAALLLACAAPGLFSPATAHPGSALAVDPDGRIYFAAGPIIVRIDTNGSARTIVFDRKNERFHQLHHFQRLPDGALVTASDLGNALWRFTPEGQLSSFYPPPNRMRALAVGTGGDPFAVDARGNVLAVNSEQDRFTQVLHVDPDGRIRVLAGGKWGHADGPGEAARFADLHGGSLLAAPDGSLYLTDDRRWVRRVRGDGTVSTIAGGPELAHVDGPGPAARFDGAAGIARLPNGDLLVAEQAGYLRQIGTNGLVRTVAGSGRRGGTDGPALAASLEEPTGVAVGPGGDVLVLEPSIPRVRRLRDGRLETVHWGIPGE